MEITFEEFPKIPRLNREIIITEKLDGTNAQVIVTEDGRVAAASRSRLITPEDDNYGFAAWVKQHENELLGLGPGRHYGEWCGGGIQKRYKGADKQFALFNVSKWQGQHAKIAEVLPPACCSVVPVMYHGVYSDVEIARALRFLRGGSIAFPGSSAEGIIIYHTAARSYFKVTLERDEEWKGKAA